MQTNLMQCAADGLSTDRLTLIYLFIYLLGVARYLYSYRTVTDLSVRCMRPYDEYRQFAPNSEGCARSNATLFDNRQRQQNRELRA